MKIFAFTALFFLSILGSFDTVAQVARPMQPQRCGTMEYYKHLFQTDGTIQKKFENNQLTLRAQAADAQHGLRNFSLSDTIPVVIHVVASTTLQPRISDAILQSQIDVLNEDFQGLNADSTRIPAAFKPLFGKSNLVFVLARQNEFGEPTNGIVRKESNNTYELYTADDAKLESKGGSTAWDPKKYLNIWVVNFGVQNVLGISVFPGDPRPLSLHGFVCDYRAFGRGASYQFRSFNLGRTTTHEIGHFFNLHHIWGDDNGACTQSDFPEDESNDDTPNQGDATYGDPDPTAVGLVKLDDCTTNGAGIMYQNFMDYTDDRNIVLFTKGQQKRMEMAASLSPDRSQLLQSNGYIAPIAYQTDARIRTIANPPNGSAPCARFTPSIILRNSGSLPLASVQIKYSLDNAAFTTYNWNGNLAPYSEINISLPEITANVGQHIFKAFTTLPNNTTDQNSANDTAVSNFEITPVFVLNNSVEEGFSSNTFPPKDWRVINPDNDLTWQRNASMGKKAPGSAWVNDWNNPTNHTYDDLVMPNYSYTNADSIILRFQLAAAVYSHPNEDIPIDTLSVLITKDCGNTFTTVYKKWGDELQTISNRPDDEFFPQSANQWRLDSVNLSQWLGSSESQFQIHFRFNSNFENNVFIDDVALYKKVLPQQLKEKGYLLLPTVTRNQFSVWHYQQPANLRSVAVYNSSGQQVWSRVYNGNAEKLIGVNLQAMAPGVYFVKLGYSDRATVSERIIKQ